MSSGKKDAPNDITDKPAGEEKQGGGDAGEKLQNRVKKVIAVMSGKGGVGKSTISYLLALALKQKGLAVGLLDADITGSSIPRLMKLPKYNLEVCDDFICPMQTGTGIKVMSINFLLEREDQPVIWRGPLLSKALQQFWGEVYWGDLDYLVIDMPPGTSDVALTIMQTVPLSGLVFVTTPQEMVSVVVAKSMHMARTLRVPLIGLIENMSYAVCPECGAKFELFGHGSSDNLGAQQGIKVLARLALSREVASLPDLGPEKTAEVLAGFLQELGDKIAGPN
mgnify:CR=1 FL=1